MRLEFTRVGLLVYLTNHYNHTRRSYTYLAKVLILKVRTNVLFVEKRKCRELNEDYI